MDFYRNFGRNTSWRSTSNRHVHNTSTRGPDAVNQVQRTSTKGTYSSPKVPRFPPLHPYNTNETFPRESRVSTAATTERFTRPKTSYPQVERPPPFPRNFRGSSFAPGYREINQDARRPQTSVSFPQSPPSVASPPLHKTTTQGPSQPRVDIMTIPEQCRTSLKGTVRVSRLDAWTRLLAYEACFQVCLQAIMDGIQEADYFVKDNCRLLKQVLQVSEMLLPGGAMIDEANINTSPFILWDESPIGTRRGSMLEHGLGNSPSSSRMPSPPRRRSPSPKAAPKVQYKVRVERIMTSSSLLTQQWALRSSYLRDMPQPTSVCVNNNVTGRYFHTFVDGNGYEIPQTRGSELNVEIEQLEGIITVDVYSDAQRIGSGSASINSIVDELVKERSTRNHTVPLKTAPRDAMATCLPFFRPTSSRRNTRQPQPLDDEEIVTPCSNYRDRNSRNKMHGGNNHTFLYAGGNQRSIHSSNERCVSPAFQQERPYGENKSSNPGQQCVKRVQILDDNNYSTGITCLLTVERVLANDPTGHFNDKESSTPLTAFLENELTSEQKENDPNTLNTCVRVTGNMAFEFLLGCVLRHENCGSDKLNLDDPWDWLVKHYVQFFGIRQSFVHLTTIKWILRPDVRSCTTHCLEVLLDKYSLLCQERDTEGLQADEITAMNLVSKDIKELLANVFENYYLLSDLSKSGIQDNASRLERAECPPSALRPALTLIEMMTELEDVRNQAWIIERFKNAAHKKYQRLEISCGEEMAPINEEQAETSHFYDSNKKKAYRHIERLASALQVEIEKDHNIQDCGFLPSFVNLPALSASIFSELFLTKLEEIFLTMAPRELTNEGVDMFIKIRELQGHFETEGLQMQTNDIARYFNVFDIFEPFVSDWLQEVENILQTKRIQLSEIFLHQENPSNSASTRHKVSPLVTEMLIVIESEMERFERLIHSWHELGISLECVVSRVLRDLTCFVSEQNGVKVVTNPIYSPFKSGNGDYQSVGGLLHRHQRHQSRLQTPNQNRMSQWQQTYAPLHCFQIHGIDSREAILLNSLRYLLGAVPDLEHKLRSWCTMNKRDNGSSRVNLMQQQTNGPEIGAQFAQLVKELRTDYSHATVHCCERMAEEITQHPQHMIGNILYEASAFQTTNVQESPGPFEDNLFNVDERMEPLFETLSHLSENLERAVDPRVLVTLLRGLWEHLGEDLYIFVENLHEGHNFQEAWKCRQNAKQVANALNEWFRGALTHLVGHDLTSKDLDLPLHASMTQKLLADNSSAINVSYTVF